MTQIIPAVDISRGKCVRLFKGRLDEATVYYDDPLEAAKRWVGEGAKFLHLVDLDATAGMGNNLDSIKKVIGGAGVPCQVGGGIRSLGKAREYIDAGAARVIFGTAALEMRIITEALRSLGPDRVMAAVDHLMGRVAIRGWKELTDLDASVLCARLEEAGVMNMLMTSIDRDGTMMGPNLEYTLRVAGSLSGAVFVAGGFAKLSDLTPLRGSKITGVVLGKSLYEGTISLKKALEAMA
jgi:phosphoribosylformimino-5-aminoimidazole carboxamide ribotide isomerase